MANDLCHQIPIEHTAQPASRSTRKINADNACYVATVDHLGQQIERGRFPERLDVLETSRGDPLLVPGTNIGQMDVAEDNTAHALVPKAVEDAQEDRSIIVGVRRILQKRDADGIRLRANQVRPDAM